jgi:hypothetical protein
MQLCRLGTISCSNLTCVAHGGSTASCEFVRIGQRIADSSLLLFCAAVC